LNNIKHAAKLEGRGHRILVMLTILVVLFTAAGIWYGDESLAAPTADCTSGNFSGIYQTQDLTFSGDLFVTSHVNIRNNVTITLEAGTNVTMCGAYQISINSGGNLVAAGTESLPIIFDAADPLVKWNRILFSGAAGHSVLRHVVLNNGGGNDPIAKVGALEFGSTLAANPLPSPILDYITINNSGAYGMYLQVSANDVTPPSISNVAIANSTNAAILANAQTLGGLGSGNVFTNNLKNTIQVIHGGASRLYHSQTWRKQDIPYEMLGTALVAAANSTDPYPTLTIEAGTTFLMGPDASLEIGTSLGRRASLVVEGTETSPVTFTRSSDVSAPWNKLGLSLYPETKVDLQHVKFSFGGSNGPAMIEQRGAGSLTLDHVTVQNSQSAGLYGQGSINVNDSVFEFNQTGLEFYFTADGVVRNSVIRNNVTAGLLSLDTGSNFTRHCIDAIGNFWGSPNGPGDAYNLADACGDGSTNSGGGDNVSGGVLYEPWLPGDGPLLDRGTIQPDPLYVVADGVDFSEVTLTLRDPLGNPLVGKQVQFNATVGNVTQPASLTDAEGKTTAIISSTSPSFAYLSAYNLTDNVPVAGLGGVTFWQGSGDAGGLIDPSGTPFASPQLHIDGKPFQAGFPVGMRLPMQNSNPYPIDVQVVYGVSGIAVGTRFAPVYTTTTTLQPNESWDAAGVWLPLSAGHHCIQATIISGDAPTVTLQSLNQSTTTFQRNTNQNPCDPDGLDPGKALPKKPGGLFTVATTFYKLYNVAKKANECLDTSLKFYTLSKMNIVRDYQQVVTPAIYNPPDIVVESGLTLEQVSALNTLAQTSADLLSLNQSLGATAQRMNWAGQAIGVAGSTLGATVEQPLYYLDLQFQAYRDFANQYADKLDLFAGQIDSLLVVMDSADDAYFMPEDFLMTRDALTSTGFGGEEVTFYQQTGLDNALITQLEQDLVASFNTQTIEPISFLDALFDIQTNSRTLADRLRAQYPLPVTGLLRTQQASAIFVPPQVYTFDVGHPFVGSKSVELVVRPVNLPLGWTYELSQKSTTIAEGESISATLTLNPSGELLEGDLVQVMVEGYVDGALIGGIRMDYLTPFLTPRVFYYDLYLPMVNR